MIYTISLIGLIVLFLALVFIIWLSGYRMSKVKDLLLIVGGVALIIWLLSKDKYKCPRCNYPLIKRENTCPNCGQPLRWEGVK